MDIIEKIKSTLLEMKQDLVKFNASPSDPEYRNLIDKYDTIFTGKKLIKLILLNLHISLKSITTSFFLFYL